MDLKKQKLCTLYGLPVYVPPTPDDPKTSYLFCPTATLQMNGWWEVANNTQTTYVGMLGLQIHHNRQVKALTPEFDAAITFMEMATISWTHAYAESQPLSADVVELVI